MKRSLCLFLALWLLILSGCTGYPDRAADGAKWDPDWVTLGTALGVETPGDELALLDNNSVLTGDDL